jgi:uncharacterized tellurite resistance protein B-like protein
MARVDEFLELVDDPRRPAIRPGHPADAALLALLAHVAFADGDVDDTELSFLSRVLPDRDPEALRRWAGDEGARPFDLAAVARALPAVEERWKALRFAVRMAWKDGTIAPEERALLARLVRALGLPADALDRVLGDLFGRGAGTVDAARITQAFNSLRWDAVDWGDGPLQGDVAAVVPADATAVLRIGIDGIEVAGLYEQGLACAFREGTRWIPWGDIVTYTRVPTLGAAVQLHTEDGRAWTLSDFRLNGMGLLLDRIFGGDRPSAPAPKVERLRGE